MKSQNLLLKNFLVLIMLGTSTFAFGQALSGDTWANVSGAKSGTITLTYVETPGFVYKDESGNVTGVCVDIMADFISYVEKTKGVKLKTRYVGNGTSFNAMYNGVKGAKGGVFGLGNITMTEARTKEITFSPAFITNFAILVTHSNVATLSDIKKIGTEFKGLKAYTAKGTMNEKRTNDLKTKYFNDLRIEYASSSAETLEKVIADPKSFAYLDLAFYFDALKRKESIKRHPVGDQSSEEFGFIMPLGSDWAPLMEEFFAAKGGYKNSTEYKMILNKHLGQSAVRLIQSVQ